MPLLRCGCERLALCGEAVDAPRSLLHRFRSAAVEATELTRNYRQHPRLADFASRHFYGGAGGSGASAADFAPVAGLPWPRAAAPACFVETGASAAAWKSNLQPDFNVRVIERFGPDFFAVLRELDESNRFVQKSAESTSI